ncbi:hypothetical protein NFI96_006214 [Prochilodus magdalenae]|nr:hypothetical protein NFI96_006214 [Prochilodus magdalenae]
MYVARAGWSIYHQSSGNRKKEKSSDPTVARRTTEPEVFTFDHIPAVPVQPVQSVRPRRRRPARVLYPSSSRRYLPRAESSPVKRWLIALCLVVLLQIYTEDDVAVAADELVVAAGDETPYARYDVLPCASGEGCADETTPARTLESLWSCPSASCRADKASTRWSGETERAVREQSARNGGYVVALLYPVYHTLGSEQ